MWDVVCSIGLSLCRMQLHMGVDFCGRSLLYVNT